MGRIKVLAIAGSPRRDGNTDILMEEALASAEASGAEVTRLIAAKLAIPPCLECGYCQKTGECVQKKDPMAEVYPALMTSDRVVVTSPIFFYGVTAQLKSLIDRCQCLWARRYVLKQPVAQSTGGARWGAFLSTGGSRGAKLFDGARLTVKYFFDAIEMEYRHELVYRLIEGKGDIRNHPTALVEARSLGEMLAAG